MELEIDEAVILKHHLKRRIFLDSCINFLAELGAFEENTHHLNIFRSMTPVGKDEVAKRHWFKFIDLLQQMKLLADDIIVKAREEKRKI